MILRGALEGAMPLLLGTATPTSPPRLPNARLAVLDGCNHLPQDEVPKALLAKLHPFVGLHS